MLYLGTGIWTIVILHEVGRDIKGSKGCDSNRREGETGRKGKKRLAVTLEMPVYATVERPGKWFLDGRKRWPVVWYMRCVRLHQGGRRRRYDLNSVMVGASPSEAWSPSGGEAGRARNVGRAAGGRRGRR